MNKRPRVDVEPPIDEMRAMTWKIQSSCSVTKNSKSESPNIVTTKKDDTGAEKIVQETGQACKRFRFVPGCDCCGHHGDKFCQRH